MSATVQGAWTQKEFFDWAERQEGRFEFDGFRPVAMTGGNPNHNQLLLNIHVALRNRLRESGCRALGPETGIVTQGDAVRYPDGLITCSPVNGTARTISGIVVVFEVLSPTSGRMDRLVKVREYLAVPSILRYVIVEATSMGLTVLSRTPGQEQWTATALFEGDVLPIPEAGIEVPVAEFYEDIQFTADEPPP